MHQAWLFFSTIGLSTGFSVPATTTRRESVLALKAESLQQADSLLYREQEKLLVDRGEYEKELMTSGGSNSQQQQQPLKVHTIRGAGSGGGFGGGGKSVGGKNSRVRSVGKAHAQKLTKEGVIRLDAVIKPDTATKLRACLYDLREESQDLVAKGAIGASERFANVLLRQNRCDMTLALKGESASPLVTRALAEILLDSPVGAIISAKLGDDAILHELSCLMSDPGSQRQVIHPDTPCHSSGDPVLHTCFVALQDVTMEMGPTVWLPQTHNPTVHQQFRDDNNSFGGDSQKDVLLRDHPSVLGLLPTGACAIFDSRLLHGGTANTSIDQSRALFYFSFKNPRLTSTGNPPSIRYEVGQAQYSLKQLQKSLTLVRKGKANDIFISDDTN